MRSSHSGLPADALDGSGVARLSLARLSSVGLVGSVAVVVGAVAGGTAFVSHLPGAWFFGTPGGPLGSLAASGGNPPAGAVVAVYGGLALLTVAWLGLLRTTAAHPGIRVGRVLGVLCIWILPLVLAPPLFSRDAYSYAGQGEMVSHQVDPYHYGTGVLGATDFSRLAGPLWANTPSPYGPTFLGLDGQLVGVAGHQVLPDLVLLRLAALGGLALAAAGLPTLARAAGRDPSSAIALGLGLGSPLVLTTVLGGAHNDALMVGLLIAGLAVAARAGPAPGIVLCALAAGVKAPAALGVVFLGWAWPGPSARPRTRVATTAGALGLAVATLSILSWVSGLGWGWLRTSTAPAQLSTGVTPVDAVAKVVAGVADLGGAGLSAGTARTIVGSIGLAVAASLGAWLLWNSPRLGTVKALGLSLLVLAVLSPVLWAWYLSWGLVVLAPVVTGVLRRVVVVVSVVEAFIGVASVSGMVHTAAQFGVVGFLVLVAGASASAAAVVVARRRLVAQPVYAPDEVPARSSP